MKIQFPFIPPSVNTAYYTDFHTHTRHKSKQYREFLKSVDPFMVGECFDVPVSVEINLYFPDKRKNDIDNRIKPMLDTLVEFGILKDDSLIQRLVVEKYYDKGKPFTILEVLPV